jgi:ribonuclease HII
MEKNKPIKVSKRNKFLLSMLYNFEKNAWSKQDLICGIDEVGRGCLLGPIVTAAAIIHPYSIHTELKDSKKTNPVLREKLFNWIIKNCSYSIGINNNHFVDSHNIYTATQTTMLLALHALLSKVEQSPSMILVDAMPLSLENTIFKSIPIESLIHGESKSASIAAASIIAKVTRDRIMNNLHYSFPLYKMNNHLGYGTPEHMQTIKKQGWSFIHRQTFLKNIKGSHDQQLSLFR